MNGKKDGVLMACYACLLVIGGLLTWLKYDYNAVKWRMCEKHVASQRISDAC